MKDARFLFFMAILSLFLAAAAPEDFSEDEDVIVVSAGKIEQSIDGAVEKVQVVSGEEIHDLGAKTLTEAVKNLPGVTVTGASAANPTDSISMQGFDSAYVKILVDGVAVSGDIGGSVAAFEIPVEQIDRIEVVQGASSALYGSDAMGGVINVITKKPQGGGDGVTFHLGANEEFSYMKSGNWRNYASLNASAAGKRLSGSLAGSFDYSPGKEKSSYYALEGRSIDYYETPKKRLGYVRAAADWRDDWGKAGVYGVFADSLQKSNFTATGFNAGATMAYATRRAEGGVTGEYKCGDALVFSGFSSAKFYFLDTSYDVKAGAASSATDTDSSFIDWETEARGSWQINAANQFLFGMNANLQTIDGDSFDARKKQLLISAFAQDTISLFDKKLDLAPGARLDFAPAMDGSDTRVMATPKFSVRYAPTEYTAIRFSYGMGFKTPTLKQKYWVFYHNYAGGEGNFILYGNPNLKNEKSQSFNLSVEQKIGGRVKITAGGYFNYISDMITSVVSDATTSPQKRVYENVNKAMTYGADASAEYKYGRFSARIGYAYTAALAYNSEKAKWEDLSLRSAHRIAAAASYMIPLLEAKIAVNAEWNSRQLVVTGGDEWTPDYLMLGAAISKMFWQERLGAYIRGDNLLNNVHFMNGTDGQNQEDYFGLKDGVTVSVGARIAL